MAVQRGAMLGDQVYSVVRDRIVRGDYLPGHVVVESDLAHELDVSRTPVSTAVVMLKERGLLEDRGGKPAVPTLTVEDVVDLYRCRLALDAMATRLAAHAITDRDLARLSRDLATWSEPRRGDDARALWIADLGFHERIYRASRNKHLLRFAQITTELLSVYRQRTLRRLGTVGDDGAPVRTQEDVRNEHASILDALEARDPDAAEAAARSHIEAVIGHLGHAEVSAEEVL